MDSKKRGKFPAWHARKVAEQAVFNFQEELLKYCESDVKLLKEGCLKFVAEFEEIAGFNPLVEAVTNANACNLFWRREKLETDLIALEPQGGWRGNRINQSKIALEWLYYQDHLLGGMGRVRHVRNGGEVHKAPQARWCTWMATTRPPIPSLNFTAATITGAPVVSSGNAMSEEIAMQTVQSMKCMKPPKEKRPCCVFLVTTS